MLLVNLCFERISWVLVLCVLNNVPMNVVLTTKLIAILNVSLICL